VHLWQIKRHLTFIGTAEFQEFFLHLRIIQVSVSLGILWIFQADTRFFIQFVKIAKPVLVENFINHFATFTAEAFFAEAQARVGAGFVAMEAGEVLGGGVGLE